MSLGEYFGFGRPKQDTSSSMSDAKNDETAKPKVTRGEFLDLSWILSAGLAVPPWLTKLARRTFEGGGNDQPVGPPVGGEIDVFDDPILTAAGPRFDRRQGNYEHNRELFRAMSERFKSLIKVDVLRNITAAYQQQNFKRYITNPIAYVPSEPPAFADFLADNRTKLFKPGEMPVQDVFDRFNSPELATASALIKENEGMVTPTALSLILPTLFSGYKEMPPHIPIPPGHAETTDFVLKNPTIRQYYGEQTSVEGLLAAIQADGPYKNFNRWKFTNNQGELLELHSESHVYKEGDSPLWPDRELAPGTTIIAVSSDAKKTTSYTIVGKSGMGNSAEYMLVGTGVDGDYPDTEVQRGFGQIQFSAVSQEVLLYRLSDTGVRRIFTIRRAL